MKVAFHPEARIELQEAAEWYEDQSLGQGERFLAAMEQASRMIQSDPERFPPVEGVIRIFRSKVFPYKFIYTFDSRSGLLFIYAVAHNRRRPEYWKNRLVE